MKKYNTLIKIYDNQLNEKTSHLRQLKGQLIDLTNNLHAQYDITNQMMFYIDAIHIRSQSIQEKIYKLEQEIQILDSQVKEILCEKKKIAKALEKHISSQQDSLSKKEVVNMDNIATINYITKNF